MAKRKTPSKLWQGPPTEYQKQQSVKLTKEQKFQKRVEAGAAKMYFDIMFPKKKRR